MFNDPTFWFLVAFLIFIALIGKQTWQFTTLQLDQRKKAIEEELETAAQLHKEAQKLLNQMKKRYEEIEHHAEAILAHGRLESERLKAEAEQEIEQMIKRREALAAEKIGFAEIQAIKEVRDYAVEVGLQAAERVLQRSIKGNIGSKLIDQALKEIKESLPEKPLN